MSFLAVVGVVILFIWHSNLSERIEKLEALLRQKNQPNTDTNKEKTTTSVAFQSAPIHEDEPVIVEEQKTPEPKIHINTIERNPIEFADSVAEPTKNFAEKPAEITYFETPTKAEPTKEFHLEDFFGKKLFAILGATSVVLAIGFFTVWAFSTGAISPIGRIIIGFAFSAGLLLFGEFLREKYPTFFDKITATGLGGLLITAYLARNYEFEDIDYQVLSASSAFFIYAATAFLGAAFSLRYNARFLGVFSILAGVIMPLWVNSDPNPVGLFSYLSIFSLAGVALALHKKWTEISVILFVAIIGYATGIFYMSAETCAPGPDCLAPWLGISPVLFLVFTYGLLYLLGSAGIIRHLRDQSVQTFTKISNTDTTEIVLFISALFIANGLGWAVFENQSWLYFGYFVLAQGIIFWFISRAFAAQNLPIFEQIAVGAASFALIFATLLEVGVEQNLMLTLILLAEGILLSFASQKTNQILFNIASKILFMLAFGFVFTIDGFANQSIAMILAIATYLFSTTEPKSAWSQTWSIIAITKITILIFTWSFKSLPEISDFKLLNFIAPILWAFGLALSVLKNKQALYQNAGVAVMALVSAATWIQFKDGAFFDSILIFAVTLAANFGILYTFFIQEEGVQNTPQAQKTATMVILFFNTISVLTFGIEFLTEPTQTISWIVWATVLFEFGKRTNELMINIASKIFFLFTFVSILYIDGFMAQSMAMLAAVAALLYSTTEPKNDGSKSWKMIAIGMITALIFVWSFKTLPEFSEFRLLSFVVPIIWALALAFSITYNKNSAYRTVGLIVMTLVSIAVWNELLNENFFESLILLVAVMGANFALLTTFFIQDKNIKTTQTEQVSATIAVLTFNSISMFIFGAEFLIEPIRTIAWIAWGGLLFGLGSTKNWPHFRYFGIGVFSFIIAKLYLIDVWVLSTVIRFVAFLALGGALLGVSFIYNKKSE